MDCPRDKIERVQSCVSGLWVPSLRQLHPLLWLSIDAQVPVSHSAFIGCIKPHHQATVPVASTLWSSSPAHGDSRPTTIACIPNSSFGHSSRRHGFDLPCFLARCEPRSLLNLLVPPILAPYYARPTPRLFSSGYRNCCNPRCAPALPYSLCKT